MTAILFVYVFSGAALSETLYDPLVVVHPTPIVVRVRDESALITDVNAARRAHGLRAVTADRRLSRAARLHARNMAVRRFFGHIGPDGASLADRLLRAGLRPSVAAENIAFAAGEREANAALLGSPEHRANILDPRLRTIGVAALKVGRDAALYVEDFAR